MRASFYLGSAQVLGCSRSVATWTGSSRRRQRQRQQGARAAALMDAMQARAFQIIDVDRALKCNQRLLCGRQTLPRSSENTAANKLAQPGAVATEEAGPPDETPWRPPRS